jgi:protocatechuate 3,4-dioxygenase beta subunit
MLSPGRAEAASGNLVGRVTDAATGSGVSGVTIWAGGSPTALTDGSGNYTLTLPAGQGYNALADKAGYAKAHRYSVAVSGGSNTRLDFAITTQQGRITGRLVDTAGRGVAGQALADSIEGTGFNATNTDSNGFFTLDRLAPTSYYVHGFPASSSQPSTVINGIRVSNGATTSVTLVSGGNAGRISGQVTQPNGAPLANAQIYIDGNTTTSMWNGATDANGVYSSGLLSAGTYNVHLSDVAPYGNQVIYGQTISAGQTLGGVSFRLSSNLGAIRGWVRDTLGNAIAGAQVDAFSSAKSGPWGWQTVTTDSNGWYALNLLMPSPSYKLWVHSPNRPVLTGDGIPATAGSVTQPYNFTYTVPGRATVSNPKGGYYVLSGEGTVFSRGGAPLFGSPHFGSDIARALAVMPDGQGYIVLDGFGGLHKFGSAASGAMGALGGAYFGWDIARGIAITPTGTGLDVLDGFGGVHTSGNAVSTKSPYFGWDIARGLALSPTGLGVYVLDGYGGVHTSGDAIARPTPYFGWDIARSVVMSPTGQGYAILDGFGGIHTAGDAPAPKGNSGYTNKDLWRGIAQVNGGYAVTRNDGTTIPL